VHEEIHVTGSRKRPRRSLPADEQAVVVHVGDIASEQELVDRLREQLPMDLDEDQFALIVAAIMEEVPLVPKHAALH
jgi:hypothetical protein